MRRKCCRAQPVLNHCNYCDENTTPDVIRVVISGWLNGSGPNGCTSKDDFNTTIDCYKDVQVTGFGSVFCGWTGFIYGGSVGEEVGFPPANVCHGEGPDPEKPYWIRVSVDLNPEGEYLVTLINEPVSSFGYHPFYPSDMYQFSYSIPVPLDTYDCCGEIASAQTTMFELQRRVQFPFGSPSHDGSFATVTIQCLSVDGGGGALTEIPGTDFTADQNSTGGDSEVVDDSVNLSRNTNVMRYFEASGERAGGYVDLNTKSLVSNATYVLYSRHRSDTSNDWPRVKFTSGTASFPNMNGAALLDKQSNYTDGGRYIDGGYEYDQVLSFVFNSSTRYLWVFSGEDTGDDVFLDSIVLQRIA